MNLQTMGRTLLASFYSRSLYRKLGTSGKGMGMLYLLFVVTVCSALYAVMAHQVLVNTMDREFLPVVNTLPRISVAGGEVVVDVEQPYVVTSPATGKAVAVIDTTGATASLEGSEAMVLVTKHAVMVRQSPTETRTYEMNKTKDFTLDKEQIHRYAQIVRSVLGFLIFPLIVTGFFLLAMAQALFYGVLALPFASVLQTRHLTYTHTVRLAAVALTPVLLLNLAMALLHIRVPFSALLSMLIALGYLYFALKCNARRDENTAPQEAA